MSSLDLHDFLEMVATSKDIGYQVHGVDSMIVQVVDEEGDIYDIVNVEYNPIARAILIRFDHD